LEQLIQERNRLSKEIESFHLKEASGLKNDLINEADQVDDIKVILKKIMLPNTDALKKLAFEIKQQVKQVILVLAAEIDGKPHIAVAVSEILVKEKGLDAVKFVKHLAKEIQGGGGGQPFFATAGGKKLEGLDNVLTESKMLIKEYLNHHKT
jgi:alanyl-tRNA synthetase